jgi:hypothetical protein
MSANRCVQPPGDVVAIGQGSRDAELTYERLPGETSAAYEAFCAYRDKGASRSTAKVARQLGKSKTLIDRWSSRWSWGSRAAAYDAYLDSERRAAAAKEAREAAQRHARIARLAQERICERLETLDVEALPLGSLGNWLDVACRVERIALGLDDRAAVMLEATKPSEVVVRFVRDWTPRAG